VLEGAKATVSCTRITGSAIAADATIASSTEQARDSVVLVFGRCPIRITPEGFAAFLMFPSKWLDITSIT
jgi:hypothetical protein